MIDFSKIIKKFLVNGRPLLFFNRIKGKNKLSTNKVSKAHQEFSIRLNNPRVLKYPDEFLGPNYEAVLDFWLFLDGLTEEQWKTIKGRHCDFIVNQYPEWDKASDEALKASEETIGRKLANKAANAAWAAHVANGAWVSNAAYYATRELIGMHILLEQQKPLTFFNMFLDL